MQTTLLGLAIAIILALVAALAGPLLIDWGSYRALFEAEASKLVGVNVRVAGSIAPRLLPSPRLTLRDIAIGNGPDTIRARSLDVELALGPLMRGEWRATELHLSGPQISLRLDASGHFRAPVLAVAFKPDELSVDRLSIEDGAITLADAASGASLVLNRVRFSGEARSLLGPVKGEGEATIDGQPYPYRIAVGRLSDEGSFKVHFSVNPMDRSLSIEADGVLAIASGEPRFDGTLGLSRPVGINTRAAEPSAQILTQPWRLNGKVKATAQSALMENAEFQYGSEEQGFKLTGVADFKFGARPRFTGVLSGRQIDLDRLPGTDVARQPPAAALHRLVGEAAAVFRTSLPIQIGVGIDQVTLGGSSIQNLRGDIRSAAGGWTLDRFEFRAPGMTRVRLSGRLGVTADSVIFSGPAELDASDPKVLAAWLEGRNETSQGELRPMSVRGDVTLADDRIAVEGLKLEFDRKPVTGRVAYFFPSNTRPAKLDAEIKAQQFDIDAAIATCKALIAGSAIERPREMSLAADIDRATFAGLEARDVRARVKVDASGLRLDQLSVGDFAGASFSASGRVETNGHAPRGMLSLDLEAKQTAAILATATKFAPKDAEPAINLFDRVRRTKLHASLDLAGDDKSPTGTAQLVITGDLDDLRVNTRAQVRGDLNKPLSADLRLDGIIDASQSGALIRLLGLDWLAAVGNGAGQMKLQAVGSVNGGLTFEGHIAADGLSAQASGKGQLSEGVKATAALRIANADLRPLRVPAGTAASLPIQMTSRVTLAGGTIALEDIDAKLAGSSVRGRIAVDGASRQINGAIESDTADMPALLARAVGSSLQNAASGGWSWSSEPFANDAIGKFTGKVALKFARARVLGQVTARAFNAALRLGKDDLALEDVAGDFAGGRLSGNIAIRNAEEGLTASTRMTVARANVATLLSAAGRPPMTGLLDLTVEAEGTGLSPIALIGSLKGSGKIVLSNGQVVGLDSRSFEVVTRAVDRGLPIENGRIADLVGKTLDGNQLSLKRAESELQISAGQIRLTKASTESKDASVSIAGTLDLTDGSMDARLVLSGTDEAAGARPNIFVVLKGPLTAPTRSVDVSALTGWLTLRAVENQTKRLRAIEAVPPQQPRGRGTQKQAPALPAPIDIRPAPAPRSSGRPAASVRSQN